ncbi:MAG TPA: hypothetical protein VEF53_10990 [Patescibacteria group bacterium]|nr:hypothetical protein [Patescibacteria group bacterium]
MSGRMIFGLLLTLSGVLFSGFWFFWASSGKSTTFNGIMEEIAREKRKSYEGYLAEDVREWWRIGSFIMLLGFTIALVMTIVNKGEILYIKL